MQFAEWLKQDPRPRTEIAAALDINRVTLYKLANGRMKPGSSLARRIEVLTDDKVRLADFEKAPADA